MSLTWGYSRPKRKPYGYDMLFFLWPSDLLTRGVKPVAYEANIEVLLTLGLNYQHGVTDISLTPWLPVDKFGDYDYEHVAT